MTQTALPPNGGATDQETPQQIDADAIVALRDPLTWMQDTVLWFLEAEDPFRAQAVYSVWQSLTQAGSDFLAQLVSDAIQAQTDALTSGGGS